MTRIRLLELTFFPLNNSEWLLKKKTRMMIVMRKHLASAPRAKLSDLLGRSTVDLVVSALKSTITTVPGLVHVLADVTHAFLWLSCFGQAFMVFLLSFLLGSGSLLKMARKKEASLFRKFSLENKERCIL